MTQNKTHIVADLPAWGIVSVSGKDATKFLQGQITQDIQHINSTHAGLSAYLTVKGRVIATFIIASVQEDTYYLILPKNNIANFIEKLSKYAIFSKVTIEICDNLGLLVLWTDMPHDNWHVSSMNDAIYAIDIPNTHMRLLLGDEKAFALYRANVLTTHQQVNEQIFYLALLKASIPTIDSQNTEVFTVHDLNLPTLKAVNFKKGCYTGQEIVARTQYKAKLKHHLYLLQFKEPVKQNHIFVDENNNEVGRIVNCQSEDDAVYALTWLRDNVLETLYLLDQAHHHYQFKLL